MIRGLALSTTLELGAAVLLLGSAVASTLRWHDPGSAVLMIYFAFRLIVYGSH